jgi:hypothetical protein
VALLICAAAAPAGCGGASQEELDRAADEARREERAKQRERDLRKRLDKLEEERKRDRKAAPPSPGGTPAPQESAGRSCGDGIEVNSVTTCPFAQRVRAAYEASGGGNTTVMVTSDATGKTYAMTCSGTSPHVCVGGNSARVEFP